MNLSKKLFYFSNDCSVAGLCICILMVDNTCYAHAVAIKILRESNKELAGGQCCNKAKVENIDDPPASAVALGMGMGCGTTCAVSLTDIALHSIKNCTALITQVHIIAEYF